MAAKVGREQPFSLIPHKMIMRDFSQFCQAVILYIVFLKSMDKGIFMMSRQEKERMSSESSSCLSFLLLHAQMGEEFCLIWMVGGLLWYIQADGLSKSSSPRGLDCLFEMIFERNVLDAYSQEEERQCNTERRADCLIRLV